MLSKREIEIVQADWAKVFPIAQTAANLFYDRLFAIAPSVRPLFKEDLTEQKIKLMKMIGAAVNGLSNLGELVPVVEALGKRHVGYGVKPEHYAPVGAALLWTLKKGLGDAFTDENEAAWTKVYGLLTSVMTKPTETTVSPA